MLWSPLLRSGTDLEEFRVHCQFGGMWGLFSLNCEATCGHFHWRTCDKKNLVFCFLFTSLQHFISVYICYFAFSRV